MTFGGQERGQLPLKLPSSCMHFPSYITPHYIHTLALNATRYRGRGIFIIQGLVYIDADGI
jgi:hypothetical protein